MSGRLVNAPTVSLQDEKGLKNIQAYFSDADHTTLPVKERITILFAHLPHNSVLG